MTRNVRTDTGRRTVAFLEDPFRYSLRRRGTGACWTERVSAVQSFSRRSKDEDEMNAFILCAVRWLSQCDIAIAPLEIIDIIVDSIPGVSDAVERRNIHGSGD
ncbi:uncharacterized protein PHACADRAFT_201774 [Phanerochaete carnosa HHB-10118-sp]|uniref:Uncharacterized protein n=1 Tax=Phanerochaete carnosa (strain HHB-10118-sp) TaxID=650164 RepID=K5VRG8_PHACS|nr:uncharacterized protein PHACADRAFT_201774 [Phanerochaete carnosa HHB-10118-sp]EKM49330.1 hypothetical protein PHACADRAFT_201774 [Phanerochaete carnosa HHB-10118-sp]